MSYLIKPFYISKLRKEGDLNDLINRITLSREKSIVLTENDRKILHKFLIYCVKKEDPKTLPEDEVVNQLKEYFESEFYNDVHRLKTGIKVKDNFCIENGFGFPLLDESRC
jgi:hypothetical protein